MKSVEQHFTDWESHVFGFGYGTGDEPVLTSLKAFLAATPSEGCYDHAVLSEAVGAPVAWLLINVLAHADIIEYGTSPRYGWLTRNGKALQDFVCSHNVPRLIELASPGNDHTHCYPDHCNCDDGDCRPSNPFWRVPALQHSAATTEK